MTPLRALHLALALCYRTQARLSRSRSSRVHHSTMHHATTHHPITAGHTQHTSKALEALHKQRDKKQAEAEAARRNATAANQPPPQAPKPPPRQAPPPRLSPTVVARAEATSCWLHVSGLHHSGTGVLRMLIARNPLTSIQSWSNSRFVEHESQSAPVWKSTSESQSREIDFYTGGLSTHTRRFLSATMRRVRRGAPRRRTHARNSRPTRRRRRGTRSPRSGSPRIASRRSPFWSRRTRRST